MQNIADDYQKVLEFICRMDDVDDLKHLFDYLDNFWQTQFSSTPILIYSKSSKAKNANLRDYWNKGKEEIYYNEDDLSKMKQLLANLDSSLSIEKVESEFFYVLNCGELKGQTYLISFKTEANISTNVLEYFIQFMNNTLTKVSRYKEADNLKSLVHIDDVTGIYNQRKFIADIEDFIAEYEKLKTPFSVIFIDIDHFKQVNDGHGHLVGSKLLKDVALILKNTVRDDDRCYRYGGDEFVVVIPMTKFEEAKIVGNRILNSIKDEIFTVEQGEGIKSETSEFKLTVSIGIACFPRDANNKVDIINMADKMMYKAKQTGRGRVCNADELFEDDDDEPKFKKMGEK